jgi:capsid protein
MIGQFQAGQPSRTMGPASPWSAVVQEPEYEWTTSAREIALRATDLIRNDPVMFALLGAKSGGTHGPRGLRFRSLYRIDDAPDTSEAERKVRDQINAWLDRASVSVDASSCFSRVELERTVDGEADVMGDGFLVRQVDASRPGAQTAVCFQFVRSARVCDPPLEAGRQIGNLFEGIEIDAAGRPIALWIAPSARTLMDNGWRPQDWTRVPWWDAATGLPNVLHRRGQVLPGCVRGVSRFASCLFVAKQTRGTLEAYVVGKRVQACHPIIVEVEDPVAAAKKDRAGAVLGPNTTIEPGKIYYVAKGSAVHFSSWAFQGADMREFIDTLYRNAFAAWGMPRSIVFGEMSAGSNQAARSDWMQYRDRCTVWQDEFIRQVSQWIDRWLIREGIARGEIDADPNDPRTYAGEYQRPPARMPEPLKEAQAARAWLDIGRDFTSVFSEAGLDFDSSTRQRSQDDRLRSDQGISTSETVAERFDTGVPSSIPTEDSPEQEDTPEDDQEDAQEDEQSARITRDEAGQAVAVVSRGVTRRILRDPHGRMIGLEAQ